MQGPDAGRTQEVAPRRLPRQQAIRGRHWPGRGVVLGQRWHGAAPGIARWIAKGTAAQAITNPLLIPTISTAAHMTFDPLFLLNSVLQITREVRCVAKTSILGLPAVCCFYFTYQTSIPSITLPLSSSLQHHLALIINPPPLASQNTSFCSPSSLSLPLAYPSSLSSHPGEGNSFSCGCGRMRALCC